MLAENDKHKNDEQEIPVHTDPTTEDFTAGAYPRRMRKRNPLTCGCAALLVIVTMACCAIPAALAGGALGLSILHERNQVTERRTETLELSNDGDVNLVVSNNVGETVIRGDDVDEIQVEMELKAKGISKEEAQKAVDRIVVNVERNGDEYSIEVNDPNNNKIFGGNSSVNLRITVPRELNITAQNDVGSMNIHDVEIIDKLDLQNNVGEIVFEGKIGPNGNYDITNDVGSVQVRLDNDSEFTLEATTNVGKINNKVDLKDETVTRDMPGEQINGVYGDDDNPRAKLTIQTNVGGIEIRD